MLAFLGELTAIATLGLILAGAAAKAVEAQRVRVRAAARKNKRR